MALPATTAMTRIWTRSEVDAPLTCFKNPPHQPSQRDPESTSMTPALIALALIAPALMLHALMTHALMALRLDSTCRDGTNENPP